MDALDVRAAPAPAAHALTSARRVVVKVGSALLVDWDSGRPREGALAALAADVARMRSRGQQVLVVSSGAVALGRKRLGLSGVLPLDRRQAAAAAGQSLLMHAWEHGLAPHGLHAAQILLTRDDTETRRRWLNARATVEALLTLGAVPVVNENDTVATEEIRYGDNDRLAARAAQMIGADVLALLSDVDGLYDADPRSNPDARRLDHVTALTPQIEAMAGGSGSAHGTGGMATKLMAARIAGQAGCSTLIALGKADAGRGPLEAVEAGDAGASLIAAPTTPRAAYKRWIAGSLAPRGELVVDDGCAAALKRGASLLAAGLTTLSGDFGKGDAVTIRDLQGRALGRGLARLDAADARKVAGLRSDAVEAVLGWAAGPEIIHADDLALDD